jgi:hypothetical protein
MFPLKKIPTWLIIILLILLLIVIYNLYLVMSEKEGFVSNGGALNEEFDLSNAYIDASGIKLLPANHYYIKGSGKIVKLKQDLTSGVGDMSLNEIIVFDRNIGVNSTTYSTTLTGNNQITPGGIGINRTKLQVGYNQNNKTQQYNGYEIVPTALSAQTYDSTGNPSTFDDLYQVFRFNYGYNTYIHTVNLNTAEHRGIFISGNDIVVSNNYINPNLNTIDVTATPSSNSGPSSITLNVGDSSVDIDTYQLSDNLHFNTTNGEMYVKQNGQVAKIRKRGVINPVTPADRDTSSTISSLGASNGYIESDICGNQLFAYVPNGNTTMVILFRKVTSTDSGVTTKLKVDSGKCFRFNNAGNLVTNSGNDNNDSAPPSGSGDDSGSSDDSGSGGDDSGSGGDDSGSGNDDSGSGGDDHTHAMGDLLDLSNNVSDYYKWYWYWNNSGSLPVHFSEDYMLKTQVVPPVCPSCPACPSGGSGGCCNNCGGNGGEGAVGKDGKSVVKDDKKDTPVSDAYGKTLDTGSDLLKGAGQGAKDIVGGTLGLGAAGVVGATGVAKDTVTGAVDLTKETVGGAVDLTKDVVGGTTDFIKSVGTGAVDLMKENEDTKQRGYTYMPTAGGYGQTPIGTYTNQQSAHSQTGPMDPYSYNGRLTQRPSTEFIPRTADFSAFAK